MAYAIGVAKPVSISVNVDTYGTGKLDDEKLTQLVMKCFDLTPRAIIERLNLRRPIYLPTAAYGHFGRHGDNFTWEKTDMVEELRKMAATL